jgi:leucyl/phenylalanyl-tRNA--protein transferase
MPIYALTRELVFPPPEGASPEGVVAVGGDTSPERLILAYSQGIFPWPHRGLPLLWFSPDPRCVLPLDAVHVGRSLRKRIRSEAFELRADTAFEAVMDGCSSVPRPGQDGTWITRDIKRGYTALHRLGHAHSIEVYLRGELVGGLYGVAVGGSFCGESMFARADDASKVALIGLCAHLIEHGFSLLDCQVMTAHLSRFGAQELPRRLYLRALRKAVSRPWSPGPWQLTADPAYSLARVEAARRPSTEP